MWKAFRRVAARLMLRLADELYPAFADADIPTLAELTPLPFDEVWKQLIAALQPWQVSQVDLAVYRQNDRSTEYNWSEPDADESAHCSWSLGVAFPRADGRRCELQATTQGSTTPDPVAIMSLTRVLQIFAMRFAIHVDRAAGLTLLRADDAQRSFASVEYFEEAA